MSDSIFTKIIKREINAQIVYEDDLTIAFLTNRPDQPGHTLVVPKKQIDHLWDLPDPDYQAVWATAKKVALRQRAVLKTDRVGVKVVGEEVPHAHVHLVPFNTIEEYRHSATVTGEQDQAALAAIADKLAF
jgi:histidine triad (HIT) family protein